MVCAPELKKSDCLASVNDYGEIGASIFKIHFPGSSTHCESTSAPGEFRQCGKTAVARLCSARPVNPDSADAWNRVRLQKWLGNNWCLEHFEGLILACIGLGDPRIVVYFGLAPHILPGESSLDRERSAWITAETELGSCYRLLKARGVPDWDANEADWSWARLHLDDLASLESLRDNYATAARLYTEACEERARLLAESERTIVVRRAIHRARHSKEVRAYIKRVLAEKKKGR